ncbi:hypothetical protein BU26DRAFT_522563 [Trematosphaeria pertusa]|uniref:Uncharacterized protein n=1 Tax=Trematosphaeria pertusa TaxID=390896 RepID=A0A6A6I5H3_9PLEO|nr:uncharacterized protein BU26DRAFT_522563 [Trematosphaeria pertusa]KAF2244813.1 hypothetical protein BU26DRAFT_522563 [Trematosphaeria pertusa]
MGAIEALLLEAGPAGVLALPAIGWASNLICGILIKQAFLTVVPDARQTYNSARRQFCHKANCLVFADTLSDHEHCGHCDNPCGSGDVCINGACSSQYCSGSNSALFRCGYGDNYDTCTCANTFYGSGLCAEYTTSCVDSITDSCDSSDDCDPGFICGLMPGCEAQTCLNVAACASSERPPDQTEMLPPEQPTDWWTFQLKAQDGRAYVQSPGSTFRAPGPCTTSIPPISWAMQKPASKSTQPASKSVTRSPASWART